MGAMRWPVGRKKTPSSTSGQLSNLSSSGGMRLTAVESFRSKVWETQQVVEKKWSRLGLRSVGC